MIGMRLYGDAGVAIATGLLTFVMLVFLKFSLKRLRRCRESGIIFKSHLSLLLKVFYPLVWLMNIFTKTLMRMVGLKPDLQNK